MNDVEFMQRIANCNTPQFADNLTWYSNGERGHLHATNRCEKVVRSKRSVTYHSLTLAEALTRTVCTSCVTNGGYDDEQRRILRSARELVRMEQNLNACQNVLSHAAMEPIHDLRKVAFYANEDTFGFAKVAPELASWTEEIRAAVATRTPRLPEQSTVEATVLRYCAVEVLMRRMSADDSPVSIWGGSDIAHMFGEINARHFTRYAYNPRNPLATAALSWIEALKTGATSQEATSRLLGDRDALVEIAGTPHLERLNAIRDLTPPEPSESLGAYMTRIWVDRVSSAIATAAKSWEHLFEGLIAPADPVLVASGLANGGRYAMLRDSHETAIVAGALDPVIRPGEYRDGRVGVLCHPTVGEYFCAGRHYGYYEWQGPVKVKPGTDREAVETLLALWDPYDQYSVYSNLVEAYDAAVTV